MDPASLFVHRISLVHSPILFWHERTLFGRISDLAGGYGGVMVGLGHRLGLYRAMAGAGPLNSQEVARRSGCADRYAREWLNSQAAGGYVLYHPASATYELTPEQAMVLASTTLCCAHALSEDGGQALGAQAGEARLADVFRKAGFSRFQRAKATPFNLILEAKP